MTMTQSNLDTRFETIFREIFDNEDLILRDDMSAKDIDGWDSLAQINLIVAIESEFGIRFKSNELASLANVGALKQAVSARVS
ncbi:MAG: acyl carrier protein [Anaerolineae bacterium]|nr:acyl carrier protein [Anaerolineae bacterium]